MELLHYILDEQGNPKPECDPLKWARWYEEHNEDRVVGQMTFMYRGEEVRVSTVFLSLPHVLKGKQNGIALFETMVFGPDEVLTSLIAMSEHDPRSIVATFCGSNDIQERYATREEAVKGHARMCQFVEVCLGKMEREESGN